MTGDMGDRGNEPPGTDGTPGPTRRHETLANAVADGLFQIDADGRFVAVNDAFVEATGRPREDLVGEPLERAFPAADAVRLSAARRGLSGSSPDTATVSASVSSVDGGSRPCEVRLRLLDGEAGDAAGSIRLANERDVVEPEHQWLVEVVRSAATAETFDEALERTLDRLCERTEWTVGEAWVPDDDELELRAATAETGLEPLLPDPEETVAPGEGLIGRVYESGEAAWIPDPDAGTGDQPLRTQEARRANLASALAVPVGDEGVVAVLACYATDGQSMAPEHVEVVESVATQIGAVLARKRSEQESRRRERFHSTLLENFPGMVYRCADHDGWTMEFVSGGCVELTGHAPEAFTSGGIDWVEDVVHPDDSMDVFDEVLEAATAGDSYEFTYPILTTDGETRWVFERGEGVFEDGELVAREGFVTDVTEHERTRNRLREETEKFESLVQSVEDYAIFMLDPDGKITSWNEGAARIQGYDADEVLGEHFSLFYTDEAVEAGVPEESLVEAAETGSLEDEGWRVRADGSRFRANVVIMPVYDEDDHLRGYAKVTRDMTDRKEREDTLRRERDLVARILEANPVGIAVLDAEGEVTRLNETGAEVLGVEPAEIDDHEPDDWTVYDEDGAEVPPREWPQSRVLRTGEPIYDWRCEVKRLDGGRRWVSINAVPLFDDAGEIERVILTAHDVTALKEQQADLRRERDLVEKVIEVSPVMIGVFDADDRSLLRANARAKEFLGAREVEPGEYEYVARDVSLYDEDGTPVPPEERPFARAIETGEPVYDWQGQMEGPGGERRWFSINATPISEEEGVERVVVVGDDITQLKEQARALERQRDELATELEDVLGRVSDAFFALDSDWRFTYVNERAEELLDCREEAVLGNVVWNEYPETVGTTFQAEYERAMETQQPVSFEEYYPPLSTWFEVNAYPSKSGLSVYFRDVTERKERERELERYATIAETVEDGIYALDKDYRFTMVNEGYAELTGYDREELLGAHVSKVLDEETVEQGERVRESLRAGERSDGTVEAEIETVDGESVVVESRFSTLTGADHEEFRGTVGVVRDVTERKERERALERQRGELAALNRLNQVVGEITHAAVESPSREEIERLVCERLADSESYRFAWIGEPDRASGTVALRTEAGVEGYLDDTTITVEPGETGEGPTARAIRTREPQVNQNVLADPGYEPWYDNAREYGFRSSATIPITYEDVLYGVLNVYSERAGAFDGHERTILARLGNVVGHAINALERKEALMSDQIIEVEVEIPDVLSLVDGPASMDGTIAFDRTVPVGGETYLVYGTVDRDARPTLEALVEATPFWEEVAILDERFGDVSFELRLSEPPAISTVAAYGGRVRTAVIRDCDYRMTVELPPSADVRSVVEALQTEYPTLGLVAQRRTSKDARSTRRVDAILAERLTDRQRATLEAAYYAGYFDVPRKRNGEEIAESLDITAPTLHQHLRKGQRRLLAALLEGSE